MPLSAFCGSEFWNSSLSLTSPDPQFTTCFQSTILVWLPSCYAMFWTPLLLYRIWRRNAPKLPWTALNISKLAIAVMLICDTASMIFYALHHHIHESGSQYLVAFVSPFLLCFALLCIFLIMLLCKAKGQITSGVLFSAWFLFAAFGAVQAYFHIKYLVNAVQTDSEVSKHRKFYATTFLVYYSGILVELILHCYADKRGVYVDVGQENPCPESSSSFLSVTTYAWMTQMIRIGWKRPLEQDDLWSLDTKNRTKCLVSIWDSYWQPKVQKYFRAKADYANSTKPEVHFKTQKSNGHLSMSGKLNGTATAEDSVKILQGKSKKKSEKKNSGKEGPERPSIVWTLFMSTKWPFFLAFLCDVSGNALEFASPQILRLLIQFVKSSAESDYMNPSWPGYLYAAILFFCQLFRLTLFNKYQHYAQTLGMHMRSMLMSAIYRKSLKLSNTARKNSTVGEIVNLMSVDAQRFMTLMPFFSMLWSTPLIMAASLYFLWDVLGPSTLAGFIVMILFIPLNSYITSRQRRLQLSQMKYKDGRIKLMNEILSGMKVLKLYAWEPPFEEQIAEIRQKELSVLRRSAYLGAAASFALTCCPILVSAMTFATYVLSSPDNILTAEKAFVSLSLFNMLRMPLMAFPMMITMMAQANVSIKRILSFLTEDELDVQTVTRNPDSTTPVRISDGVFSWDSQRSTPTLRNINLELPKGSLVAVVGSVGSGKTSLISAVLGEMDKLSGSVNVSGSVAYVPQQAWLQNATLRENITFLKQCNEQVYERVIDACALRADLAILPGGDSIEIGEKGINLSGGQKQRISLARAVYQDADIYFLDDPLSAVDSHVGKHIFEHVIGKEGVLKNKTRLLVTHALTYLRYVDKVIVLTDGQISEVGTYEELLQSKGAFSELLQTYLVDNSQDSEDGTHDEIAAETVTTPNGIASNENSLQKRRGSSVLSQVSADFQALPPLSYKDELRRQKSHQLSSSSAAADPEVAQVIQEMTHRAHSMRELESANQSEADAAAAAELEQAHELLELRRKSSVKTKLVENGTGTGIKLMTIEQAASGGVRQWEKVSGKVYSMYMNAMGFAVSLAFLFLFAFSNALSVYGNSWLSSWSNVAENLTVEGNQVQLTVYVSLGAGQALTSLVASLLFSYATIAASKRLHGDLVHNLMRSPLSFFETTPLGRILNRCGKDVDSVDAVLPETLRTMITCAISVIGVFVLILASAWVLGVTMIPLAALYFLIQRFYIATSRQLKRLESILRSPIYSQFQETLTGSTSIRAYGVQNAFINRLHEQVDLNVRATYPSICANRWLLFRMELVGDVIAFCAVTFAVANRENMSPGLVGLIITYSLSVTLTLYFAVRMATEVETNIVSVERIKEYSETPQEAEWEKSATNVAQGWPQNGRVLFEKFALRYRPELDLALREINCDIRGGEKIGIVGRTGAGKSSLTTCLFRIIEAAGGRIMVDGVDISKLGLHELRRKLTIIPQDPVLFSGTMRINLDPFVKYSDAELWRALEHAHLKTFISSLPDKLDAKISEGGENLSVGQRQLVCLARALLRKTKVLILDEATAAVDLETDDLIQKTIRSEFSDCTTLTIAHRLNTIMDSTRVMVLDKGSIVEMDSPAVLLSNRSSIFFSMAKDAGLVQ